MKHIDQIINIFYPRKCILCRKLLNEDCGNYFCDECSVDFRNKYLDYTKERLLIVQANKETSYEEQLTDKPHTVIALFPHSGRYRKAVLRWKYQGIRRYAKGFASLLVDELKVFETISIDLLIPVPLSPQRQRKRGFNQAKDLAAALGERTQINVCDCLKRIRNTKPQAECTLEERRENIKGSIVYDNKNELEHINNVVIIDDIYTTGSTISECIKILRKQFAFRDASIYAIVVNRGDFMHYRRE